MVQHTKRAHKRRPKLMEKKKNQAKEEDQTSAYQGQDTYLIANEKKQKNSQVYYNCNSASTTWKPENRKKSSITNACNGKWKPRRGRKEKKENEEEEEPNSVTIKESERYHRITGKE